MRYFLPLALCVAVGVTAGPPAGYEIRPMTWKGAIEKSGPEMSFDGTIQVRIYLLGKYACLCTNVIP